jgi:thioredoxin reductase (NADPH)
MDEIDVVIAGGGLAGSAAALTAARLGMRTVMLAPEGPMGALAVVEEIEGAPGFENVSGYELCPTLHAQAVDAGTEVRPLAIEAISRAGDRWLVSAGGATIETRSVVAATGTTPARLGVPGEAAFTGRGVSNCASCDGPLFRGMEVVVVGGGDSALQESLTLRSHQVKLTVVQQLAAFTAQESFVTRLLADRTISAMFKSEVVEILGEERVSWVRILDSAAQTTRDVPVAGVFVYVGRDPVTDWLGTLDVLDEDGRVVVDASMASKQRGLFAAGDIRSASPGHATSAMGDGVSAATSAFQYLKTSAD